MRGGTSKGLFLSAEHLPADPELRARVLLAIMGSPDTLQIDGIGGGHPLTSKVAIISKSEKPDADVEYLFLQIRVDKAEVSSAQNCGNMLAGVGPWAIENGLVKAREGSAPVRIHMVNTDSYACVHVPVINGNVVYTGNTAISGVPGSGAAIKIEFLDVAGSSCGALLPTGNLLDNCHGVQLTCIDNGMPVILIRALDVNVSGHETPEALEANKALRETVEVIRLEMGPKMNLGDVSKKSVPKISLLSAAQNGGVVMTRTFIPHNVHRSIGVLGAVSVATGCMLEGTVVHQLADMPDDINNPRLSIEHPTGALEVEIAMQNGAVTGSALIRTARKIMAGEVFVPAHIWAGT